jgi:hypothetical protein
VRNSGKWSVPGTNRGPSPGRICETRRAASDLPDDEPAQISPTPGCSPPGNRTAVECRTCCSSTPGPITSSRCATWRLSQLDRDRRQPRPSGTVRPDEPGSGGLAPSISSPLFVDQMWTTRNSRTDRLYGSVHSPRVGNTPVDLDKRQTQTSWGQARRIAQGGPPRSGRPQAVRGRPTTTNDSRLWATKRQVEGSVRGLCRIGRGALLRQRQVVLTPLNAALTRTLRFGEEGAPP